MKPIKINILGTEYTIEHQTEKENPKLENANGLCEVYTKKIIICDFEIGKMTVDNVEIFKNKVLRHEIIHAFIFESGLWENTSVNDQWATNEEMVDWIAIQFPKILKVYQELDIL